MKIVLFARPQISHSESDLRMLVEMLEKFDFDYCINSDFADKITALTNIDIPLCKQYASIDECSADASMMMCYGGDGTFLEGVRRLGRSSLPILGINSGRLGFLANVPKDSIEQAFEDIKNGAYKLEKRSLLKVEGDFDEPKPTYPYAFNEFSIQRDGAGMISVEAFVDNEMIGRYWGDGVILATPTGSTAYSLSVGGPILSPGCECFVLSSIAPHNLTMRPVVLPDSSAVTFKVGTREKRVFVTLDNSNFTVRDMSTFRVSKSKKTIFLVKLQNISFYDTLRNKMMWGFDRRDDAK